MIDKTDQETWTGSYVLANRADCLITLQAHNLMAIDYLRQKTILERSPICIRFEKNCS